MWAKREYTNTDELGRTETYSGIFCTYDCFIDMCENNRFGIGDYEYGAKEGAECIGCGRKKKRYSEVSVVLNRVEHEEGSISYKGELYNTRIKLCGKGLFTCLGISDPGYEKARVALKAHENGNISLERDLWGDLIPIHEGSNLALTYEVSGLLDLLGFEEGSYEVSMSEVV